VSLKVVRVLQVFVHAEGQFRNASFSYHIGNVFYYNKRGARITQSVQRLGHDLHNGGIAVQLPAAT
jgi:hypothetical protein